MAINLELAGMNLPISTEELNLVLNGLANLKYRESVNLINKIGIKLSEQGKAEEETNTSSENESKQD